MGNQHANGSSCPSSASNSTSNLAAVVKKSAKSSRLRMAELWELRRRSVGTAVDAIKKEEQHNNCRSFTFGQSPSRSMDTGDEQGSSSEGIVGIGGATGKKFQKTPPRIEINGVHSAEEIMNEGQQRPAAEKLQNGVHESQQVNEEVQKMLALKKSPTEQRRGSGASLPSYSKHRAQKVDSRKIVARKRLERGQTTTNAPHQQPTGIYSKNPKSSVQGRHPLMASLRASDLLARSLDAQVKYNTDICLEMKPLSVRSARSVSPLLHQQRRHFGSSGGVGGGQRGSLLSGSSLSGDDGVLSREQSDAIQKTWHLAKERILQFAGPDRCFGFFAFDRIFERAPELKPLFGISPSLSLIDVDEQSETHPFTRHSRIFTNILDLSVRNAAELETEMLPVLFAYGQRHFRSKIMDQFNERTVRLFCSQVVGTMCDLLDEDLGPFAQEAWIEMVTFLGRALLSGFEHERQQQRNGSKRFSLIH